MMTTERLDECRQDIDRIDAILVALLRERARLALDAGALKRATGHDVVAPARERDVLTRVRTLSYGPLSPDAVARIFEQIISETRAVQTAAGEQA
jgi:chorismate mutase